MTVHGARWTVVASNVSNHLVRFERQLQPTTSPASLRFGTGPQLNGAGQVESVVHCAPPDHCAPTVAFRSEGSSPSWPGARPDYELVGLDRQQVLET